MATRQLFSVDPQHHGGGPIIYAWHPDASYMASVGPSRVVHVWDRYGKIVSRVPPSDAGVTGVLLLEWDADGEFLAEDLSFRFASLRASRFSGKALAIAGASAHSLARHTSAGTALTSFWDSLPTVASAPSPATSRKVAACFQTSSTSCGRR